MAIVQLQIGDLAKQVGVSVRTIGFYEEKGLLTPSSHTASGMRLYTIQDANRLKFIKGLRHIGFPIKEIQTLMKYGATAESRQGIVDHTMKLLNIQKVKTKAEIMKLNDIQKEIEASIKKVEMCSHCQIEPCQEDCPNFGQAL
ncbi:MAG: MerR family transcriptional regulator [Dehalogenimonas sp.]|uniref:MerR family transcriptional regulator n=1 Tax=Candidatus Dehalogenimonas loeffleri TaxID=3127115 RepID=A0ABZ2J5D0_9CHLR|nr:MerR family transcriptional regulator [Dehalogenimonas sp.]